MSTKVWSDSNSIIVLEIKIKRVRFIAGLAEINKAPYFKGFSHFVQHIFKSSIRQKLTSNL